jgi:predicted amidophosphoribosyltransferase
MQIINLLLDLFFPRRCVRCEKEGSWLCTNCELLAAAELLSISKHDNHISLFKFEPGPIRELLHRLKYNGIRECAETLAVFLEKYGNRTRFRNL